MDTFSLGTSTVHRVGFGAMQLPGPGVFGPPRDHDAAIARAPPGRRARRGPHRHRPVLRPRRLQRADPRGPAPLLRRPGAGLQGRRRPRRRGRLDARPDPAELRAGVEDNLRSLGVERLGAVNLRRMPDDHAAEGATPVPFEDQLAEMVALRDEGKIAGIGVSTVTLAQVEQAIDQAGIVCVQNAFSLVDQQRRRRARPLPRGRYRLRALLPARLRVPAACRRSPRSRPCRRSAAPASSPRRRSVWPGCSPTATTCCSSPGTSSRGAPRGEPAGGRDHPVRPTTSPSSTRSSCTAPSTAYAGLICSSMIASRSSNGRNADFIALMVNQRRSSMP